MDEYVDFGTHMVLPKSTRLVGLVLMGCCYLAFGAYMASNMSQLQLLAGIIIGVGLMTVLRFGFLKWDLMRAHRALAKKPDNSVFFETHIVEFNSDGVGIRYDDGLTFWYPWKRVIRSENKPDGVLLLVSSLGMVWVPNRALDESTKGLFLELLRGRGLA
jgi:hypothetical protein